MTPALPQSYRPRRARPKVRSGPRVPAPHPAVVYRRPGGRRKALAVVRKVDGVPSQKDSMHLIHSFWDASQHRIPVPLRTTFGNFATINVVDRFTFKTSANSDTIIWLPWTASPLAALEFTVDQTLNSTLLQHLFKPLAFSNTESAPRAVRPMRQSFRISNLTKTITTGSGVFVLSYDNALQTQWGLAAAANGAATLQGPSTAALRDMILDAPETKFYPTLHFNEPQTFVSVPSSWPSYNNYHPFNPFRTNSVDLTSLSSGDLYSLIAREDTPFSLSTDSVAYPVGGSTQNALAGFGDAPPMRGHLIFVPANNDQQIMEFEVYRQIGARFAANALGHTFHHTPVGASNKSDDDLLKSVQYISSNASSCIKSIASDAASAFGGLVASGKALSSDANTAMGLLSKGLRNMKLV